MWEFEIFDIFPLKQDFIVLTGKLVSGGPLSNKKDILAKNTTVSLAYNVLRITKKVVRLDGWLQRPGQDLIAEAGDNLALVLKKDDDIRFLSEAKVSGYTIPATLKQDE